ncbi:MAG: hypothetical protein KGZ25_11600 [Planctomycetes bacterium]|nr:hypothetical protein [Planctomycetota bacterium]
MIGCSAGPPDPDYDADSVPGGRYLGREKYESEDVSQWLEWEVDFLKYDWRPTDPISCQRMGRLLEAADREIVFSICTNARLQHAKVYKRWAHMWRGIPDTADRWQGVQKNAFVSEDWFGEDWRPHIGPGGWHDLDMMALGPQFETNTSTRPNRLTRDEQITHMTAWALYPSPLILSCNLAELSDFELRLFANEEVIAVNQDPLGKPAVRIHERREQCAGNENPRYNSRIWVRPLADGSFAVAFFNLAETADELSLDLETLGVSGAVAVRNLWERRDCARARKVVPPHGAQLLKVAPRG